MLGDLPRDARDIRGFPLKDVFVIAEEVNERAFLFGGKRGTNAHHFALGAIEVYEDFLRALGRFKQPGQLLGVGCFFGDLLHEGGEFPGGDDRYGVAATLNLAHISLLEGGAGGDDPMGARHLQLEICIVGDGHELCVA